MSDTELKLLFIAISAAFWSAAIIFGSWLFRQTEEQRAKIVNMVLKRNLKGNITEVSDHADFRYRWRMLQMLFAMNVFFGIGGTITFIIVAIVALGEGPGSEVAQNSMLFLIMPIWLEIHVFWIVTVVLGKRILAAAERRRILNDVN